MRPFTILLLALVASISSSNIAWAGEDSEIKWSGYAQFDWDDDSDKLDPGRIRLKLNIDNKRFGLLTEVAGDGYKDLSESNWLRRLHLKVKRDRFWVSAGLQFTAAGLSTPWPGGIPTARYPDAYPFGLYAWGVQVGAATLDGKAELLADLTGPTGGKFDNSSKFDNLEASVRLRRNFESGRVTLAVQGSGRWVKAGAVVEKKFDSAAGTSFTGGVFVDGSKRDEDKFSATTSVVLRSDKSFRPHVQGEYFNRDVYVTVGFEYHFSKWARVVLDYDRGPDEGRAEGLLQFHF